MLMDSKCNADARSADLSLIRRPDCAWDLADLANVPKNGVKVFSTFACGGGSTMGYKLAGCDVIGANDIDPEMAWHYKVNLSPKHYFLCPIRDLIVKDLPEEFFGIDILDGSPPCSTFSTVGSREDAWGKEKHFREGQSKQVLSDLFFDFLDLAERLRPKVVIAENVKGMIIGNAKGYTKLVMSRFREIGYRPQLFLINAADCGVPQRRERVFFCAIRDDIRASALRLNPKRRWISTGYAVSDLNAETQETQPTGVDLKWWHLTKCGASYAESVLKMTGKQSLFGHQKLHKEFPSPTLTANSALFMHWEKCRKLSFAEWKRFGSFPDDYQAKSDKIGKYMIGMSVPPRMMEVVARAVCSQWLGVEYATR
jgi:DNA (cytosine-5)-methyltransferase 1